MFYLKQQERDRLLAEVENLAANSDGQTLKVQDVHSQKLKTLEAQVTIILLSGFCSQFKSSENSILVIQILKYLTIYSTRFLILRRNKRIRFNF